MIYLLHNINIKWGWRLPPKLKPIVLRGIDTRISCGLSFGAHLPRSAHPWPLLHSYMWWISSLQLYRFVSLVRRWGCWSHWWHCAHSTNCVKCDRFIYFVIALFDSGIKGRQCVLLFAFICFLFLSWPWFMIIYGCFCSNRCFMFVFLWTSCWWVQFIPSVLI
jgi:hypothetical protein